MAEHNQSLADALGVAEDQASHPVPWALLVDTDCGLYIVCSNALVRACNSAFADTLNGRMGDLGRGVPIADLLPEGADAHRIAIDHTIDTGDPAAVDGAVGDRVARTTYRATTYRNEPAALATVTRRPPDAPPPLGVRHLKAPDPPHIAALTRREREVLCAIGQGLSTAEIATQMGRSTKTVEGHRVSLGNKLGVTNRVQLARIAIANGFVHL